MHPILFEYGSLRLSTYGLFMALSFVAAIMYLVRDAKRAGENPEVVLDLTYYILIASIIGARLFYIIINWDYYAADPLAMVRVWEGGLVFYGGIIGAVLATLYFVRKYDLNFWSLTDFMIPAVPLGHVFGRMGCLFAGCCYGKPAENLPWAITFANPTSLAPKHVPLHPTQIYSSLTAIIIFLALVVILRRKRFDGQVILSYFLIYPIARSLLELFRGDYERKFLPLPGAPELISTGQATSILLFSIAAILYAWLAKKNRQQIFDMG